MISRRSLLLSSLASGAGSLLFPGEGNAQAALKSLQMFIPAAPGGGWDQTGRSMELALRTEGIIKEFKFEHAPGAGGAVGMPKFLGTKRGQGDAVMVAGLVMVGSLVANKSPVSMKDLTPVARLTSEYEVVVVNAASPLKTMADLVATFKADPAKVSWAGGSAGGTDHILAGLIAKSLGIDARKVSYVAYAGGGPAQAALLGNQVTCGISGYGEFAEQIKAGKLRPLAISAGTRQADIDVPTLKESGVDVELSNWRGVFGAPGIGPDKQKALIDVMERMAKSQAWKAELAKKDWVDSYLPGADFGAFLVAEIERVTGVLKDLGLAS
ncbi:MAG: tripartite tricarboxylate transporter substrate binding protein [Hyphomicrobiales bacterium]|nr:MAG: tripartite tricarboxylate transporter substrate binding protein [Hyphomicrobiales bacterium]